MAIYVASKAKHRPMWRQLRSDGFPIVARWIDTDDKYSVDPTGLDYSKLWGECLADVRAANALVCYCKRGEVLKGALLEVGAALALNKPVILCGDNMAFEDQGTWPVVINWTVWKDPQVALTVAETLARQKEQLTSHEG